MGKRNPQALIRILSMNIRFGMKCNQSSRFSSGQGGFATAEWLVMMVFTVGLLGIFVQGLYVENVRSTTLAALRDSARAGGREGDLRTAAESTSESDDNLIINACETRLEEILRQTSTAPRTSSRCEIGSTFDPANNTTRYFVVATAGNDYKNIALLPGAQVFAENRLNNLSARYYPTENAR